MQLRDHPLMKGWPPPWVSITDTNDRTRGEVGNLRRVGQHLSLKRGLLLWVEYQGSRYIGLLLFDDVESCQIIGELLEQKIGVSMKEIGDLDLSFTL